MQGPIQLPDRPRFFDELPADLDAGDYWGFYLEPVAIESVEARIMLLHQARRKLKDYFDAFILVIWYDYRLEEARRYLNQPSPTEEEFYEFYAYLSRLGQSMENACKCTSNFGAIIAKLKNEDVNRTTRDELPRARKARTNPMDAYLDEPWAKFTSYYKKNYRS